MKTSILSMLSDFEKTLYNCLLTQTSNTPESLMVSPYYNNDCQKHPNCDTNNTKIEFSC